MSNSAKKTESPETALYPIRTVSDLTDVNAITLRAWERRYGLFEPIRKTSGHRLYTQAHIDLITRVVGLLDRGMHIGQIKAQLEAEKSEFMKSDQVLNDTCNESGRSPGAIGWAEMGLVPDRVIRACIRRLNRQRLEDINADDME